MLLTLKNGQEFEVRAFQTGKDLASDSEPSVLWFETFQDHIPTCKRAYPDEWFNKEEKSLVRYCIYSEDVLDINFNWLHQF